MESIRKKKSLSVQLTSEEVNKLKQNKEKLDTNNLIGKLINNIYNKNLDLNQIQSNNNLDINDILLKLFDQFNTLLSINEQLILQNEPKQKQNKSQALLESELQTYQKQYQNLIKFNEELKLENQLYKEKISKMDSIDTIYDDDHPLIKIKSLNSQMNQIQMDISRLENNLNFNESSSLEFSSTDSELDLSFIQETFRNYSPSLLSQPIKVEIKQFELEKQYPKQYYSKQFNKKLSNNNNNNNNNKISNIIKKFDFDQLHGQSTPNLIRNSQQNLKPLIDPEIDLSLAIQTIMEGEYLFKLGRIKKLNYFFVNPQTKIIYWSKLNPKTKRLKFINNAHKFKNFTSNNFFYIHSLSIEYDPLNIDQLLSDQTNEVLVIKNLQGEKLKLKAKSKLKHNLWLKSLNYLLTNVPTNLNHKELSPIDRSNLVKIYNQDSRVIGEKLRLLNGNLTLPNLTLK